MTIRRKGFRGGRGGISKTGAKKKLKTPGADVLMGIFFRSEMWGEIDSRKYRWRRGVSSTGRAERTRH